jgi:spore coat polysaccharide biosynthesis protein SpsF (cytidylyltransferase family)
MDWFLIQARLGSTRFPKKIIATLYDGISILEFIYSRILLSKYANSDNVVVLIPENAENDELAIFLKKKGIKYFRGDEENVLKRFRDFLILKNSYKDRFFIRICSDNPFIEPIFIDEMISKWLENKNVDYISYISDDKTVAIQKKYGLFCELVNCETFVNLPADQDSYCCENVTPTLYLNKNFRNFYLDIPKIVEEKKIEFTVDFESDLQKCRSILSKLTGSKFSYNQLYE